MRIVAMAAGAVGGYFGARMAAAGHDVFFIARGANLEAIKKNGLKIDSVHGDLHLPKPTSPTTPRASARSTSCCSRSSCGIPRKGRRIFGRQNDEESLASGGRPLRRPPGKISAKNPSLRRLWCLLLYDFLHQPIAGPRCLIPTNGRPGTSRRNAFVLRVRHGMAA